jgi:hypothetical protein
VYLRGAPAKLVGQQEYVDIHAVTRLKKLGRDKAKLGAANTLGGAFD